MKPQVLSLGAAIALALSPTFAQETATIQQHGTGGTATINQSGNTVQDTGDGNSATINQHFWK